MSKTSQVVALGLFTIAMLAAAVALQTLIIWALWNSCIPAIWHGAPHLGYWQTMGLMVLFNMGGAAYRSTTKVSS